ncbi:hypothetical protein [Poriferisphaera sp. WC338]|uniref:hypothetical protein n=1 Tax=Poriferisphaera sp. WC338 TaxID=3425129 RepID=UPI003D813CB4
MTEQEPSPAGTPSPNEQQSDAGTSNTKITDILPFPDHRDLYVLIVGLLLGIVLSANFLGAVAPNLYNKIFLGNLAERTAIIEYEKQVAPFKAELQAKQAAGENQQMDQQTFMQIMAMQKEEQQLKANLVQASTAHTTGLLGIILTLVLAVVAVSVIETQIVPNTKNNRAEIPPSLGRLTRLRYVILAAILTIIIAQPNFISTVPITFAIILIGFILFAGLFPFGKKSAK